jgi:hypothetical protein
VSYLNKRPFKLGTVVEFPRAVYNAGYPAYEKIYPSHRKNVLLPKVKLAAFVTLHIIVPTGTPCPILFIYVYNEFINTKSYEVVVAAI